MSVCVCVCGCNYDLEGYAPNEEICGACLSNCVEVGECDTCGGGYDLASRWNRCGDCGDCGKCCQHAKEWEAVNV